MSELQLKRARRVEVKTDFLFSISKKLTIDSGFFFQFGAELFLLGHFLGDTIGSVLLSVFLLDASSNLFAARVLLALGFLFLRVRRHG
jgi:hypothetical protein